MMPSDNLMLIEKNESRDITEAFTGLHFVGDDDILGKRVADIFITDFYRHPVVVVFDNGSYTTFYPDDAGESLSISICNELIERGLMAGYIGGQTIIQPLVTEYGYDIRGKKLVSLNFYKSEYAPCIFLHQVANCAIGLDDGKRLVVNYMYDCGYIVDGVLEEGAMEA